MISVSILLLLFYDFEDLKFHHEFRVTVADCPNSCSQPQIKDIGINVPVKEFVKHVEAYRPDILGLSALLTTTMPQMKKVIEWLEEAGLRDDVKVMVGGAPVNEKYARDIGADGYAADAGESVDIAKQLLK